MNSAQTICACGGVKSAKDLVCSECWYYSPADVRHAATFGSLQRKAAAKATILSFAKQRAAKRSTTDSH